MADLKAHPAVLDHRLDPGFLALLLAEPEGADERHRGSTSWVGAGDRAGPDPGDDGGLAPVGEGRQRVEVADAPLRFLAHPGAVVADVLGEALGAEPRSDGEAPVPIPGVDRWAVGEAGRQLDERLRDEHGDRVQVASMRDEAEALCFEGDRPTAAERVEDLKEIVPAGASDLLAGLLEDLLVLRGFSGV